MYAPPVNAKNWNIPAGSLDLMNLEQRLVNVPCSIDGAYQIMQARGIAGVDFNAQSCDRMGGVADRSQFMTDVIGGAAYLCQEETLKVSKIQNIYEKIEQTKYWARKYNAILKFWQAFAAERGTVASNDRINQRLAALRNGAWI